MYFYTSCDLLLIFNWIYIVMAAKSGTTPYIKDIFIGRCWQYQRKHPVNINCTELWTAFKNSFAFRNSCEIRAENYTKFFNILQADANKTLKNAMFYSGSYNLVDDFTYINDDFVVLEETLTGYVLDKLRWCGSPYSIDGLNYTHCEKKEPCDAVNLAWKLASAQFARRAVGTAHTILNASRSHGHPAYYEESFFRMYEMPELRVEHLVVFVASDIGNPLREKCGENSLLELSADAKKKNITLECIDQPELVLRIFCLKFPQKSQCKSNPYKDKPRLWKIVSIVFIAITAVTIVVIIGLLVRHRSHKYKHDKYLRSMSYSKKSVINHEEVPDNNNEVPV